MKSTSCKLNESANTVYLNFWYIHLCWCHRMIQYSCESTMSESKPPQFPQFHMMTLRRSKKILILYLKHLFTYTTTTISIHPHQARLNFQFSLCMRSISPSFFRRWINSVKREATGSSRRNFRAKRSTSCCGTNGGVLDQQIHQKHGFVWSRKGSWW